MSPPPWSFSPATALKAIEISTSLYLPFSAMQTLKIELGFLEVWASTSDPPGAVLSSTIFQTLPSAVLPVTPDFQPSGNEPTLDLSKLRRIAACSPAHTGGSKA